MDASFRDQEVPMLASSRLSRPLARECGWFVVNAEDAAWMNNDATQACCIFESDDFVLRGRPDLSEDVKPGAGFALRVLRPGRPADMYHADAIRRALGLIHVPGARRHGCPGRRAPADLDPPPAIGELGHQPQARGSLAGSFATSALMRNGGCDRAPTSWPRSKTLSLSTRSASANWLTRRSRWVHRPAMEGRTRSASSGTAEHAAPAQARRAPRRREVPRHACVLRVEWRLSS